jgi:hypothetical protein
VHPITGEILDADIVLTDGWIRHFNFQYYDLMPEIAMEGMSSETIAWLGSHPEWDPRVRLAPPAERKRLQDVYAAQAKLPYAGHPLTQVDSRLLGDQQYDGLVGRTSQVNGFCNAAFGKQMDMSMARMALDLIELMQDPKPAEGGKPEEKKAEKPKEDMLDGMPESFIGPLLADLVAHEVGHTLGLRHNFKASGYLSLKDINSNAVKGQKTIATSVMDYIPINMPYQLESETKGDYTMIGIGPYDYWAIEYGYLPDESKLAEILKRSSEPEMQYSTDEDTSGPDPLARRYDYSKDPLDYSENQMRLVKLYRERLLDKFVKDGDSWAKARRGYELTLGEQTKSISMMANWLGGTTVNRDKKGDPGNRPSLIPVPAEQQRKALDFVIRNAFRDDSFGLTNQILSRLTVDKWADEGVRSMGESTFPIHDRILGIQASALTMVMNPTTLRRVYDNEQLVPSDQDAVTLPEVMNRLRTEIWSELDGKFEGEATPRKPRISSWRRNLQREHLDRLIDLAIPGGSSSNKAISSLSLQQLKEVKGKIDTVLAAGAGLDPYSQAHLGECTQRITKALDAIYIYNQPSTGGGSPPPFIMLGKEKGIVEVPVAQDPSQDDNRE